MKCEFGGIDIIETVWIFVLDGFLEDGNSLAFWTLNLEGVTGIISKHQTVEIELWV